MTVIRETAADEEDEDESPETSYTEERHRRQSSAFDPFPRYICAPMVRYSKLAFRSLVRRYGVQCAYTPMIYARDFTAAEKCRAVEFTTDSGDWPLIVQFASSDPVEYAKAAQLIYGQSNGVDLNCGCPKKDTTSRECGSHLLKSPDLIADMVRQVRRTLSDPDYAVSVKIRLQYPLQRTVDLVRQVEAAGVSHITVHARTPCQRVEPPDYEALKIITSSVNVPVIANGAIESLEQADRLIEETRVNGVMAANGLLDNPGMFAGHRTTQPEVVLDWLVEGAPGRATDDHFHRHLGFMLRSQMSVSERREFAALRSRADVTDYVRQRFAGQLQSETEESRHE